MYPVKVSVRLTPVWHNEQPLIRVGVPGNLKTLYLDKPTTFNFDYIAVNNSSLIVEFLNKTNVDTIVDKNLDKAIVIDDVSFFNISDTRFIWQGVYTPIYPDHLIDQPKQVKNITYLGFNGLWKLDFTVPVFTWIHQIQSMGWIYK